MLNTKQAAEKLGINPKTLTNWRAQGRGPEAIQLSKRVTRYPVESINKYLASKTVAGK
jgi:predicted site-specific integrase-resolvase